MSDLFSALSRTAFSLDAHRAGLDVVGQNLANVNTPGYTRRMIALEEIPPPDLRGTGGGVDVLAVTAARTPLLDARLYREAPTASREAAVADQLAVVEAGLGMPGASLDASLTAFFDAFATLAGDPGSTVSRQLVTVQGQSLSLAFQDVARRLDQSQHDVDLDLRSITNEVNALASTIASLNAAIATSPGSTDVLKDQRANALSSLANLIDIDVTSQEDGVNVAVGDGRALVAGANTYEIDVASAPPQGFAHVFSGSTDITAEITGGRIGGQLLVRDTLIPGYLQRLDELAVQVVNEVNTLHSAGYDLNGTTGVDFFVTPSVTAGAAAGMAMNAAVAADTDAIAAARISAAGDNQVARAIAELRNGSPSATEGWATLLNRVGTDRRSAMSERAVREDVMHQIESLRSQVSGVSVDEEAAMMLRFQRAYEANARFFRVVDNLLDVLLSSVG